MTLGVRTRSTTLSVAELVDLINGVGPSLSERTSLCRLTRPEPGKLVAGGRDGVPGVDTGVASPLLFPRRGPNTALTMSSTSLLDVVAGYMGVNFELYQLCSQGLTGGV
jgi:hypothetical protein